MKKAKYFEISELVAPEILEVLSTECCWRLVEKFHPHLDALRELAGMPLCVNGATTRYKGVRPRKCPIGAAKSSHKGWEDSQGFDITCANIEKLRMIIHKHHKELQIVRMENPEYTPGWAHIDISEFKSSLPLIVFNP